MALIKLLCNSSALCNRRSKRTSGANFESFRPLRVKAEFRVSESNSLVVCFRFIPGSLFTAEGAPNSAQVNSFTYLNEKLLGQRHGKSHYEPHLAGHSALLQDVRQILFAAYLDQLERRALFKKLFIEDQIYNKIDKQKMN